MVLLIVVSITDACTQEGPEEDLIVLESPGSEQLCPPDETLCINAGANRTSICEIDVIFKPVPSSSIISARAYFATDATGFSIQKDQNLSLAEMMMTWSGTQQINQFEYDQLLTQNGAAIWTNYIDNFVVTSLEALGDRFDDVWPIYVEKIMHPEFTEHDFDHGVDVLAHKSLSSLDNPQNVAFLLAKMQMGGRTDEIDDIVDDWTTATNHLRRQDVISTWESLHVRHRMTLVIAGDTTIAAVRSMVKQAFCSMPLGESPHIGEPQALDGEDSTFAMKVYPDTPTYMVVGAFWAPSPRDHDYPIFILAMQILSNQLYDLVRFESGLAYTVGASNTFQHFNTGLLWFSSADPLKAAQLMGQAVGELKRGQISDDALLAARNEIRTSSYATAQQVSDQTWKLGLWQVIAGDSFLVDTMLESQQKAKKEDIQRVSNQWLEQFRFGITGPDDVTDDVKDGFTQYNDSITTDAGLSPDAST